MTNEETSNPEIPERYSDPSPVFDSLDVDLVVKVLAHTIFSPFFTFLIPVFYYFQGAKLSDPNVLYGGLYYVAVSLFWSFRWISRLYRNQGSLFFGPGPLEWTDQIVVITGGSSGIGELLANTLAVRNVTVIVLDVNPIVTENYNINFYMCDVSKWEEVQAVHKQIVEEIGDPTILINNAGVVQGKLLLDLEPADVKQTFEVNSFAHFWMLKAFLPAMLKSKRGHIVTVSSIMGKVGSAQMTDYCASKAASASLHESLRYELDNRYNCPQIRTTLVLPGHTFTPLFATAKLPTSQFFKFFAPSLAPITVIKAIIQALDEQHSQTILLPFFAHFVPFVQLLPSFGRDYFQWISGADHAMKGFVKISGRRPEEGPVPEDFDPRKYH